MKVLPKGTTTFLVDNLLGSTNYTFRIKAITPDNLESEYASVQAQTPKALDVVNLQSESTYIDVIPNMAGSDNRLHAKFLQNGSATGRFSSQDPNSQSSRLQPYRRGRRCC